MAKTKLLPELQDMFTLRLAAKRKAARLIKKWQKRIDLASIYLDDGAPYTALEILDPRKNWKVA